MLQYISILFCHCTRVSSANSAEGVSFPPYQLSPLVSGAYTPLTPASLRMLPSRAHWPRPSISIMYGCGTVCDITLFARYCLVIPRQKPPKVGFGAPTADGFFFKRCAAGRRARLYWAFARDMPVACFARWYTWLRPEAASLDGEARGISGLGAISTSATARPHTPITVLWYDTTLV